MSASPNIKKARFGSLTIEVYIGGAHLFGRGFLKGSAKEEWWTKLEKLSTGEYRAELRSKETFTGMLSFDTSE
ncbi:MAG: hypothetical protein ACK4SL_03855 [Candidatus Paceibacteria bacterium]